MEDTLRSAVAEATRLFAKLPALSGELSRLGESIMTSWKHGGKLLIAGNGGSMADAMHFAEELSVRFRKNRRALAAFALCDPAAITCAGNDFSFDTIFERQVEALGRPGDLLIVLSTSGRSVNLIRAVNRAKEAGLKTVAFLGGSGGELAGRCDVELLVQSDQTARIQEAHKLLFHCVCEWIDARVD
ncbi:MAG: SIS domain-containing protein [Tepidisphaeraceae bacterium]